LGTTTDSKESLMAQIDDDFPAGLRVQHVDAKKIGTVQAAFGGPKCLYDPWEVPIVWDGETVSHGVTVKSLRRLDQSA